MSLATISLFLLFLSTVVSANEKRSVYEELQHYDFPIGVLPEGVIGYELNPKTGEFSVYLNDSCRLIKGVISKGRLRKLSGVSVKVVLLWWLNIVEVMRSGDNLQFSVGFTSASFPIGSFERCPRCECGLYCVHEDDGDVKQKLPVSSS
ncbi:unnamed protein product [Withania somnifera]